MSVLKSKRKESTAEYVNIANQIYGETLEFIVRLSNRYQRLLGPDILNLASKIVDNSEMANNIVVNDNDTNYNLRKTHLLEARSAVMALDVHMSYVWNALMQNPQGAFANSKGVTKSPPEAQRTLNNMADSLGLKIDEFKNKVTKIMESDLKRYKKYKDNKN